MKHYIIGSCPPPLGGISVYIYRYKRKLESEGESVEVIDTSRMSHAKRMLNMIRLMLIPENFYIQFNSYDFPMMIAMLMRPFPAKITFYHHGHGILDRVSTLKRMIFKRFLKRVDECLYVGPHLPDFYRKQGFVPDSNKMRVQSAFLPPPPEDEQAIWQTYDQPTLKFIDLHQPLIVANAFKLVFYNGVELYGLDMCIDLIAKLKKLHPDVGLIFALAEIGDNNYFDTMRARMDELEISDNIHFIMGQKELWPMFKKADLMVRPTCVDGYGISIAEALYFGCPAVASNVCSRADGAIIFDNRDFEDLSAKCIDALRRNDS